MTYTWPTQNVVGHINLTILSFLLALMFSVVVSGMSGDGEMNIWQ